LSSNEICLRHRGKAAAAATEKLPTKGKDSAHYIDEKSKEKIKIGEKRIKNRFPPQRKQLKKMK
jgi:hypothetical protein